MARKSGSLLERNVSKILTNIGLKPELNKRVNGYEIDVFFTYQLKRIGIECKQRDKGSITVRNLIHEWHSKNSILKFDRIVIALYGVDPSASDRALAKKYGIYILDEDDVEKAMDESYHKKMKYLDKFLHTYLDIDTERWKIEALENKEEALKKLQIFKQRKEKEKILLAEKKLQEFRDKEKRKKERAEQLRVNKIKNHAKEIAKLKRRFAKIKKHQINKYSIFSFISLLFSYMISSHYEGWAILKFGLIAFFGCFLVLMIWGMAFFAMKNPANEKTYFSKLMDIYIEIKDLEEKKEELAKQKQ